MPTTAYNPTSFYEIGDQVTFDGSLWQANAPVAIQHSPQGVGSGTLDDQALLINELDRGFAGGLVTGGQGGTVVHVTNNANSGAGSLRTAIATPNSWIVFDGNYTITLTSNAPLANNVTLDGRGRNVTIGGTAMQYFSSDHGGASPNIVFAYLTFTGINSSTSTSAAYIIGGNGNAGAHQYGNADLIYTHHCTFASIRDQNTLISYTGQTLARSTMDWCAFGPNPDQTLITLAGGFVPGTANASTDTITSVAHGYVDKQVIQIYTSPGGVLPGGIIGGNQYFVRLVDANDYQISVTKTGAILDITTASTNGTNGFPLLACSFDGTDPYRSGKGPQWGVNHAQPFKRTINAVTAGGSGANSIQTTAAHTYTTGQVVLISAVVGSTGVNGIQTVTVIDTTHFSIAATVGGTYASGGSILASPEGDPATGDGTWPTTADALLGTNVTFYIEASVTLCNFDNMIIRCPKNNGAALHTWNNRSNHWGEPEGNPFAAGYQGDFDNAAQILEHHTIFRPYVNGDSHNWGNYLGETWPCVNPATWAIRMQNVPAGGLSCKIQTRPSGTPDASGAPTGVKNWYHGTGSNLGDGTTTTNQTAIESNFTLTNPDWLPVPYTYDLQSTEATLEEMVLRGAGNIQPWTYLGVAPPPSIPTPGLTGSALLNLFGIGQRQSTFNFYVADRFGNLTGARVYPEMDKPPSIDNDSSRTPKRQMSAFTLTADQAPTIDLVHDRIVPKMRLEDGSEWPLGLFMFTDSTSAVWSYGQPLTTTLMDQGVILNQAFGGSVSLAAGQQITALMNSLLAALPLAGYVIDPSTNALGSALTYSSSDTTEKALGDLAVLASMFDTYFDNNGICRLRNTPPAVGAQPTVPPYEVNTRMIQGTITLSNNLLSAPNRFIVVDSSSTANAVMGVYDLPASATISYANRGYNVTALISIQGIGTPQAAQQAAYAASLTSVTETANWSSPPDPRHDTFDLCQVLGNLYLETHWTLPLTEGSVMTHTASRIWQD